MRAWAAALHRWFFEEGDAASAAALRIGYGLVLLFLLWDLWPALDLLLGHGGYFGTLDPAYLPPSGLETFLYRHDSPGALRVWFWAATAAAACATVGLASRAAVAVSLALLLLMQRRNPFMLYGADGVLLHVALWLAWLPSGRVWSCDRLIGAWAGRPARRTISLWPIKALQTQMALIYLAAGLAKVATEPWRDGSAVYYALLSTGNDVFPWLGAQKPLLALMTYATVAIELGFAPLVFWAPTRWLALGLVASLQVGIDLFMGIRLFGPVMYLGLLSFVRPSEWLGLARHLGVGRAAERALAPESGGAPT